ncbi:hypothetical protein [Sporolituus thermophilus]|uniref:Uncharacterized protein n=1 Tax=Sporolituus thermophilus DSM 23256 TaxID=1123285 RepID=A0A1G7LGB3_9FIRM|nr:hypothetical protein [Sporolituus thermophilus]SDF48515.1 hypothetical protein SAMN05660235_01757 [Sporolituus thermophilus DSM 23256]
MTIKMTRIPVKRILFDSRTPDDNNTFEFTIDCGAVYFGAVYDGDGSLLTIDQYFYTDNFSRDDLDSVVVDDQLLAVDDRDFPTKTYLLTKGIAGNEWLRFHAVVPDEIDPDYFYQKYVGE